MKFQPEQVAVFLLQCFASVVKLLILIILVLVSKKENLQKVLFIIRFPVYILTLYIYILTYPLNHLSFKYLIHYSLFGRISSPKIKFDCASLKNFRKKRTFIRIILNIIIYVHYRLINLFIFVWYNESSSNLKNDQLGYISAKTQQSVIDSVVATFYRCYQTIYYGKYFFHVVKLHGLLPLYHSRSFSYFHPNNPIYTSLSRCIPGSGGSTRFCGSTCLPSDLQIL